MPKTIVKSGVAKKSILEINGLVICNPKKLKSKARKIMNAMSKAVKK